MFDGEAHRQPFFKFFLAAFTHRFDYSGGVAAQDQVNRWFRMPRPSPLELPVINHTFFILLCLLIRLQIYWRDSPPALLESSIDFVIQLKEKFNGWMLPLPERVLAIRCTRWAKK
jgi:hypothetical protein